MMMNRLNSQMAAIALLFVATTASSYQTKSSEPARVTSGLQVLYDFADTEGAIVRDRSGVGKPVNLRISNPEEVRRAKGSLTVVGETLIRSNEPPKRVNDAIRRSNAITVEAWIRPANVTQTGPARILSISRDANQRNITLGQDGNRFEVRLRTNQTSGNGIPALASKSKTVKTKLTHVVYTRNRSGRAAIFVDAQKIAETQINGSTNNWQATMRLVLANEHTRGRQWRGAYHLVALYSRDLLAAEIERNFKAGPSAGASASSLAGGQRSPQAIHFETKIAPLLAEHCFECHDSSTKKGGLDLARKSAALKGGESGAAIVPTKAHESLLWEMVEADDMPVDRPPLSDADKKLLKEWIDAGAIWSTDVIDPSTFAHGDKAAENFVRRLTVNEYIETVQATVGVDIEQEARDILPADVRADGFNNTAYNLNVDLKHVEAYARLAEIIVSRLDVEKFARRFSKSKLLTDKSMRGLIAEMGKWVLRGPLEEHEIVTLRGISTTVASAGGDFNDAVGFILEAMLQSPRFIYHIERQRGDGSAWPVGDYELASRLSYMIWGAPPDAALYQAAENGGLYDVAMIKSQVERMLNDRRAERQSREFAYQWLNLGRLDNLRPDRTRFPMWNDALAADMRAETLAYFHDVAWKQKRSLGALLNAQVAFATPRLAAHYGFDAGQEAELTRYNVSRTPGRGGLLTQGSILTIGGDQASMVTRGLFVLHDLLRGSVKDPPPCVDTTPVPTKAGLTQRGIAEARIANANCGGCHSKFEPLAFGLEKFDGVGAYFDVDRHGNKLRDDGEILFPGAEKAIPYQTSAELMDLLAGSERVQECITWKLAQFSLGRPLGVLDAPIVKQIHESAQKNGGTYQAVMMQIATSELVRFTRTEQVAENR